MVDVVAQPRNHYDYDWGEAERRFRAAVKREPLSTHLRQWYASFWLLAIGRPDEALLQLARVMDEDPLCQIWHYLRSGVMECLGRPDDALAALRTAIELDPKFWLGPVHLGMLYATRGQHAEAMHCAEKGMAAAPWSPYSIGLIAGALAKSGQAEEAEPLLVTLRGDWYGAPVGLVYYYLALGEIDTAVEWAGKAVEQRFPAFILVVLRPFEPLFRQSAAWPSVLKAMNLA